MAYIGHKKFLIHTHPFRRQKKSFNGWYIRRQNILDTLLDTLRKTTNSLNVVCDLVDLKIRPKLTCETHALDSINILIYN